MNDIEMFQLRSEIQNITAGKSISNKEWEQITAEVQQARVRLAFPNYMNVVLSVPDANKLLCILSKGEQTAEFGDGDIEPFDADIPQRLLPYENYIKRRAKHLLKTHVEN